MASVTVIAGPEDSSVAANALRVGFIALARSSGLDQTQIRAAWKTFQTTTPPSDFDSAWAAVMNAVTSAPAVEPDEET